MSSTTAWKLLERHRRTASAKLEINGCTATIDDNDDLQRR